jgi:MFS family permease
MAAGLCILVAFVWRQFKVRNPMTPPDLFRSKTFSGVNIMTLLLYGALAGALFFLPFNLIQVQHYSATAAGASFLPLAILMGGFSRWAGGLVSRFGSKLPLVAGPLIVAAGFIALAFARSGSYWVSVFPGVFLLGAGMTITVAPLTATVMGSIPQERSGVASGINNAISRIAGLLAVAAFGAVVTNMYLGSMRGATASLPAQDRRQIESSAHQLLAAPLPQDLSIGLQSDVQATRVHSFLNGYRLVMLMAAGLAALSAGVAASMVGPVKNSAIGP